MPAVTQERSSRPNSSTRIDASQRPVNMSTGSLRRHVDYDNDNDNAASDEAAKRTAQPADAHQPCDGTVTPVFYSLLIIHLIQLHRNSDLNETLFSSPC